MRILNLIPAASVLFVLLAARAPAAADLREDVSAPVADRDATLSWTGSLPAPGCEAQFGEYLYRLADTLADAYFDRKELPGNRWERLHRLASDVAQATLDQHVTDWRYPVTLLWIGHRETRLASSPRKLGNEDMGKAHGYFQVWSWKGMDAYSPATALDMLTHHGGAWMLPEREPWTGYPDAARWISEHPFTCR